MPLRIGRGSGVAVVELHGVIGSQIKSLAYSRIFDNVARNKSYRALLLDIDSPGGSASASEALHRSIERVAERKPVYAYIRGTGASGGYYLACAASQDLRAADRLGGLHRRDLPAPRIGAALRQGRN